MIPLRDDQAERRFTAVNTLLIAVNVAVFVHEMALGPGAGDFLGRYAMVPARVTGKLDPVGGFGALRPWATTVTSMFLHAGFLHLGGNMLYLFIFGPAVEQALGHARFLGFYLVSGVAAALAMVAFTPHSHVPMIGASGAIAGVLGAYFVLYPGARILTLFPVFVFFYSLEIPAVLYLLAWFVIQLYWGLAAGSEASAAAGGVAWWAHVGGFLAGMVLGPMIMRRSPRRRSRR
jgi:rhomboid family protein